MFGIPPQLRRLPRKLHGKAFLVALDPVKIIYEEYLKYAGYSDITVLSSLEELQADVIEVFSPTLILIDWVQPAPEELVFLKDLSIRCPGIVAIILSDSVPPPDANRSGIFIPKDNIQRMFSELRRHLCYTMTFCLN